MNRIVEDGMYCPTAENVGEDEIKMRTRVEDNCFFHCLLVREKSKKGKMEIKESWPNTP